VERMVGIPVDPVEQLRAEKALLVKADKDIEDGLKRLRHQKDLVLELQAGGHDIRQAERLVELMKDSLIEWERHRILIIDRVAYLEKMVEPGPPNKNG
jgi:hypothetical protein